MHGLAAGWVSEGDFGCVEHEPLAGSAGTVEGVSYNREVETVAVACMKSQLMGAACLGNKEDSCSFFCAAVGFFVIDKPKIFPVCDSKLSKFLIINLVWAVIRVKTEF